MLTDAQINDSINNSPAGQVETQSGTFSATLVYRSITADEIRFRHFVAQYDENRVPTRVGVVATTYGGVEVQVTRDVGIGAAAALEAEALIRLDVTLACMFDQVKAFIDVASIALA